MLCRKTISLECRKSIECVLARHALPQRVAVRENGTPYWLLRDHPSAPLRASLGSTAVVVDASGTVTGERRYVVYGGTRARSGTVGVTPIGSWRLLRLRLAMTEG